MAGCWRAAVAELLPSVQHTPVFPQSLWCIAAHPVPARSHRAAARVAVLACKVIKGSMRHCQQPMPGKGFGALRWRAQRQAQLNVAQDTPWAYRQRTTTQTVLWGILSLCGACCLHLHAGRRILGAQAARQPPLPHAQPRATTCSTARQPCIHLCSATGARVPALSPAPCLPAGLLARGKSKRRGGSGDARASGSYDDEDAPRVGE
jgi:hypothetical protein